MLKDAVGVLLEGTPSDVNLASLRESIAGVPGVASVHDLHVWSLTSGVNAMGVRAVLANHALHDEVLAAVQKRVTLDFKIAHAMVQVECKGCAAYETHLSSSESMSQPLVINESNRAGLVKRGRYLEYFTIVYNSLEGLIAVAAGLVAGSIALVGFGFDSLIEVTSGSVLLWRLHADVNKERRERVEATASE